MSLDGDDSEMSEHGKSAEKCHLGGKARAYEKGYRPHKLLGYVIIIPIHEEYHSFLDNLKFLIQPSD